MDKEKLLNCIKQILEQEELSAENRASLELHQREINKSKTFGDIKDVLIELSKFFISNIEQFKDFFF